jgi:outer membrane biosynthesis protein TonB
MGYKGPKIARYLHPSGYREVIVHNVADLSNVDAETQAVRIGHTVGKRKRADIIAKAKELDLKILNFKFSAKTEDEESKEINDEDEEEQQTKDAKKEKSEPKKEKKQKKSPKKEKKSKSKSKKEIKSND